VRRVIPFEVGHKPVRKRPVSEAVKRIENST